MIIFFNLLISSYYIVFCILGILGYIKIKQSDKMDIVDDKMSNQFSIYSCNKKINDVFSKYVIFYYVYLIMILICINDQGLKLLEIL